jgi:hypothetical protein
MVNVPPLNQNYTNTCYAHAGSVMLDAWLHSHGGDKSKLTSSLSAAVFNKASMMSAGLGNISCAAIDAIEDYGRCEKTGFDDKVWNDFKFFNATDDEKRAVDFMKLLEAVYVKPPRRASPKSSRTWRRKRREWRKENEKRSEVFYCAMDKLSLGTFDSVNIDDIEYAMNSVSKKTFYKRMVQALCGDKIEDISDKMPSCESDMRIRFAEKKTPKKFKNKIHELLESENPQPVGVGYCSGVLFKGKNFRGFKEGILGFVSLESISGSSCGLHESVVIGRKVINGKCHLKIRNSWGADYSYTHWDSDNNGNVWVEEDAFTQNMGSLTYLK